MSKIKNKITVKEFVNKYNALTSDRLKEDYLKSIVRNTYVPFENKVTICEQIVNASYFVNTKGIDGVERKKMHINSPAKYMLYCLNIVKNYTNIAIDFKNNLEEFNMLNKNGYIDLIFEYIPDREVKEFRKILHMVEGDLIQNKYETHSFISEQVERFGELTGTTLAPLLQSLIEQVENLDEKKVDKIVSVMSKFTKK